MFIRWMVLAVVVLACVAVGAASYQLAGRSWNAVVDYESPYLADSPAPADAAAPIARRTVLVIVDGLTLEGSRLMSALNTLRSYGTDLELVVPQPSLSYPSWTTILTGAPPEVSGVVTNWHTGPSQAETVFDTARLAGVRTAFAGPDDFDVLYGVGDAATATYMRPWDSEYRSGDYVDAALRLAEEAELALLVVHLPDIDEAGHAHGAGSQQYGDMVARVGFDLGRLVDGLQDGATVFVIVSDHGHTETGGHGGWEPEVTRVPSVFAGPGVRLDTGEGVLEEVAPTVAALAGIGVPRFAMAEPSGLVLGDSGEDAIAVSGARTVVRLEPTVVERSAADRARRLPVAGALVGLSVLPLLLVGLMSRTALAAALTGTAAYYVVYNGLFFLVHGYHWSLSALNSEERIQQWMSLRMGETALAGLIAVAVASAVYPLLRERPRGPRGPYLAGWLTLGPTTVLLVLSTLGLQVAWFLWWWGVEPVWRLPDLMWGFKFNLDLVQATALGATAAVAPLVSYLVGRYHPRVVTSRAEE